MKHFKHKLKLIKLNSGDVTCKIKQCILSMPKESLSNPINVTPLLVWCFNLCCGNIG